MNRESVRAAVLTVERWLDDRTSSWSSGFNREWRGGPYTVRKYYGGGGNTHVVCDSRGVNLWHGNQSECDMFEDIVNERYAHHIMVKGTAAEGL